MQTVKSFGVLSVAKTFAIIGALFGVLAIPISWITMHAAGAPDDTSWHVVLTPIHLLMIIGTDAVVGLFYGAVGAAVYNLVARWTGGIQLEL